MYLCLTERKYWSNDDFLSLAQHNTRLIIRYKATILSTVHLFSWSRAADHLNDRHHHHPKHLNRDQSVYIVRTSCPTSWFTGSGQAKLYLHYFRFWCISMHECAWLCALRASVNYNQVSDWRRVQTFGAPSRIASPLSVRPICFVETWLSLGLRKKCYQTAGPEPLQMPAKISLPAIVFDQLEKISWVFFCKENEDSLLLFRNWMQKRKFYPVIHLYWNTYRVVVINLFAWYFILNRW